MRNRGLPHTQAPAYTIMLPLFPIPAGIEFRVALETIVAFLYFSKVTQSL